MSNGNDVSILEKYFLHEVIYHNSFEIPIEFDGIYDRNMEACFQLVSRKLLNSSSLLLYLSRLIE